MVPGAILVLAGLGGAALAMERHMALSESLGLALHQLEDAQAAAGRGDRQGFDRFNLYFQGTLEIVSVQRRERDIYGTGGLGGIWMGAALMVCAAVSPSAPPFASSHAVG